MASNDPDKDSFSTLSLTEEEVTLSPWHQLLTNGGVNRNCVKISTLKSKDTMEKDVSGEPEEYFSDGDLSENEMEERVHDTCRLELRNYQIELAEKAIQGENTIICAPTGSGKTRVATYIIANHLRLKDGREKKVAFLARTVPLVVQQYKTLCKYLPDYDITRITGESEGNTSLHLLLPEYDVVVMTPMILENHITRKWLPNLGMFSMLVFDECQHTRKGEPYNTLMTSYLRSKHDITEANRVGKVLNMRLPQIVGLTASIGIERANCVEVAVDNILKVCGNLDVVRISTVESHKDELTRIVPVPAELEKKLSRREDDIAIMKIIEIMEKLEMHMQTHIKELKIEELKRLAITRPMERKSQEYEQWTVHTMQAAKSVPLSQTENGKDISVRLIVIITQYLLRYRFALETYDLVELKDVMDFLEKCFQDLHAHDDHTQEEDTFYEYFVELKDFIQKSPDTRNPNLEILTQTLEEYILNKGQESRGIIFVRTRALAEALASWLNRCQNEDLRNLNARIFTGSNMPEEKGGTSQSRQESIIQLFRSGFVRLIVATSVAEEGIDIPECNLVVKYNNVGNEVSVVQTRGRSRAFGGVSVLLAMGDVLERELFNKQRAELMKSAIDRIRKIKPAEFKSFVERHQQELLESVFLTEAAQRVQRQQVQNVPFKIICPLCRKVSIDNTNMRTIYGKYRVSIDRKLLDHIKVKPYSEPGPMDGLFFLGDVLCKGEIRPGEHCNHTLGVIVKYKGIPMVNLGIQKIAFYLENQANLLLYRQWKKVPFIINEIDYEDIKRYVTETNVLGRAVAHNIQDEEDDDSTDNEDSD